MRSLALYASCVPVNLRAVCLQRTQATVPLVDAVGPVPASILAFWTRGPRATGGSRQVPATASAGVGDAEDEVDVEDIVRVVGLLRLLRRHCLIGICWQGLV